ncbi:hypothetical protein [uncultured Lacinutrix sp.]|uniref:hypothetical protein n=1 Tax=uncultured Lacinutrix sp. TaxID=574032 RepID=UPI00260E81F2|nr:hypothetical protein [uncultured Lacinutrix sp.]
MKKHSKISVLFVSLFFLIMSSCENEPLVGFDSNDGNPFTNSLIGTWALSDFDVTVNNTSDVGGMSIESNVEIDGFNPNYNLTFATNTFTTNGSYSYNTIVTVNGQATTDSYTLDNVTGAGVYSTNGNEMTVDGSFFEFTFQGMDLSELGGEQTVNFAISADGQTLTFTQNTTETNSSGGSTTTSIVNATSVWTKTNNTNNSCNVASNFASSAETAYNNDTTNADLCDAYRAALQNQINVCGDSTGEIQAIIDGLDDCNGTGSGNLLFLKNKIFTYADGSMETETYNYDGNKLISITYSDGSATNFTYDNDILTRIDNYNDLGGLGDYVITEYNSSNELISYTVYITPNEGLRFDLTYNSDDTINIKEYSGDHDSQTTLIEDETISMQNNQITFEDDVDGLEATYSYDNKNGIYKNISNLKTLNLINIDFSGYIDGGNNNLLELLETENGVSNIHEEHTYTYNSDNYPVTSTYNFDGAFDSTIEFIYY